MSDHRHQPENLADRIDWAIKQSLFSDFMEAEGLQWEDPILQSLDLEYHNLNPERGLYYSLRDNGNVAGLIEPGKVDDAIHRAPQDTRARIRGQAVDQERDHIKNIHWTGIEFNNGEYVDLSGLITKEDVAQALDSNKEQFAWK